MLWAQSTTKGYVRANQLEIQNAVLKDTFTLILTSQFSTIRELKKNLPPPPPPPATKKKEEKKRGTTVTTKRQANSLLCSCPSVSYLAGSTATTFQEPDDVVFFVLHTEAKQVRKLLEWHIFLVPCIEAKQVRKVLEWHHFLSTAYWNKLGSHWMTPFS